MCFFHLQAQTCTHPKHLNWVWDSLSQTCYSFFLAHVRVVILTIHTPLQLDRLFWIQFKTIYIPVVVFVPFHNVFVVVMVIVAVALASLSSPASCCRCCCSCCSRGFIFFARLWFQQFVLVWVLHSCLSWHSTAQQMLQWNVVNNGSDSLQAAAPGSSDAIKLRKRSTNPATTKKVSNKFAASLKKLIFSTDLTHPSPLQALSKISFESYTLFLAMKTQLEETT